MNNPEQPLRTENQAWTRHLSWLLIGIGVIAFGLIIADRLTSVFQANDDSQPVAQTEASDELLSEGAAIEESVIEESVTQAEEPLAQVIEPAIEAAESSSTSTSAAVAQPLGVDEEETKPVLDLEEVFGSRVVFVSASNPMYVITEDDKRFDIGSPVETGLTFAGATQQQIILNDDGDLVVITLPDPSIQ